MSFSMEQLLIDNETIGMNRFAKKGIEVAEDTIDLQDIRDVGPGGDFLGHPTTLANVDIPSKAYILDRNMYGGWAAGGKKDAVDVAHEMVVKYLAQPPQTPLSKEALAKMDEIIDNRLKQLTNDVY